MSKISKDGSSGNLHPRESLRNSGVLASFGAEVLIPADGASSIGIQLTGAAVLSFICEASVDGFNFFTVPVRGPLSPQYFTVQAYAAAATFFANAPGAILFRVRCTAYTSGSVAVVLSASPAILDDRLMGESSFLCTTATGAAGGAVTLTIPGPGTGLRAYITHLSFERHAAALLTAGVTPVLITSTNLNGGPVYSMPADAAAQGSVYEKIREFSRPVPVAAQNTATTFVAPATPNVIWRMTAHYYPAP
jgi:hypothetical protein